MSSLSIPWTVSLYSLNEEFGFSKSQNGIDDEAELKEHFLAIQAKAYKANWTNRVQKDTTDSRLKVFPFPCVRRFMFTGLRSSLAVEVFGYVIVDSFAGIGDKQ